MQTELLKLIENFDVISFDVFDTLLLRPYLGQEDWWRDGVRVESHNYVGGRDSGPTAEAPSKFEIPVNQTAQQAIEQAIRMNPGINRKRLSVMCGLSEKTIGRQMKLMDGHVEFRGAPKTGGYYVVDQ